jgi:hypothetical protein
MARRRGRPSVGERVSLGLRVTPEMKRRLDEAAKRSGRSQSQEAEFRLEGSFDRGDLLPEVLGLKFGRDLAGVLMLLGNALIYAEGFDQMHNQSGRRPSGRYSSRWGRDPGSYDEAVDAAVTILQALRPPGQAGPRSGVGVEVAKALLKEITDGGTWMDTDTGMIENTDVIRSLLGPLIKRIDPANSGRVKQGRADKANKNE